MIMVIKMFLILCYLIQILIEPTVHIVDYLSSISSWQTSIYNLLHAVDCELYVFLENTFSCVYCFAT